MFAGKNAWKSPVILKGSLEFLVKPFHTDSFVEIFLREQMRTVKFKKVKEVTEEQFQLSVLNWDTSNFREDLDVFDSKLPGINNLSRFTGYGMVCSLPFLSSSNK